MKRKSKNVATTHNILRALIRACPATAPTQMGLLMAITKVINHTNHMKCLPMGTIKIIKVDLMKCLPIISLREINLSTTLCDTRCRPMNTSPTEIQITIVDMTVVIHIKRLRNFSHQQAPCLAWELYRRGINRGTIRRDRIVQFRHNIDMLQMD